MQMGKIKLLMEAIIILMRDGKHVAVLALDREIGKAIVKCVKAQAISEGIRPGLVRYFGDGEAVDGEVIVA